MHGHRADLPAAAGQWEVSLAAKADLHSPDNSYQAVVQLECLNAAGAGRRDASPSAEVFGKRDWQRDQEDGRAAQGRRRPRGSRAS